MVAALDALFRECGLSLRLGLASCLARDIPADEREPSINFLPDVDTLQTLASDNEAIWLVQLGAEFFIGLGTFAKKLVE